MNGKQKKWLLGLICALAFLLLAAVPVGTHALGEMLTGSAGRFF